LTKRMRQIGMDRILFASDAPPFPGNGPREYLERWHQLPLTPAEFRRIESNIAPYLKSAR
jgi:predicted TIM-barrel fold metal-dependent hydrolase